MRTIRTTTRTFAFSALAILLSLSAFCQNQKLRGHACNAYWWLRSAHPPFARITSDIATATVQDMSSDGRILEPARMCITFRQQHLR